jgi:hypothetical protein
LLWFLLPILMYVWLRTVIHIHAILWVLCCLQLSSTRWTSPPPTNSSPHKYQGIHKMYTSSLPDCYSYDLQSASQGSPGSHLNLAV